MTFVKPDKLPELATLDVANGILGANNVQEPPTELKEEGWDFGQKPEREFFNWYGRYYYLWAGWFDQEVDTLKDKVAFLETSTKNTRNYFTSQF